MTNRGPWVTRTLALAVSLFVFTSVATAREGGSNANRIILAFGTMYGVDEGFVGAVSPIRGVVGDELPWEVKDSAKGVLRTSGRLRIRVRGLVFTEDDVVPPELRGINDFMDGSFRPGNRG